MVDHVRHEKVNWAKFAVETNVAQWKFYSRRVRVWIKWLATLLKLPIIDVFKEKGFGEYYGVGGKKGFVKTDHFHMRLEGTSKKDVHTGTSTQHARSGDL